jgi:hypothetical protein
LSKPAARINRISDPAKTVAARVAAGGAMAFGTSGDFSFEIPGPGL